MMKFGLIGKNISYSQSPKLHKTIAGYFGLDITYDLIDIDESDLSHTLHLLRTGFYQGLNVTIPYKQKIMQFIDELTPKAEHIQAVNCLYMRGNLIIGDNTDYDGFVQTLHRENINVFHKNVYLLGTGGAAKACYIALKDLNAKVHVVTRKREGIDPLFKNIITYDQIDPKHVDLYIQATPIGTYPNSSDSVLPEEMVNHHTVIDLIYNPLVTQIMKYSKRGINGLQMLIIQALKSEEIWFNKEFELTDELYLKINEVLSHEQLRKSI